MSTLSICIPTRNRAHFLERHLRYIAAFKELTCEVVVSDNCSEDNTPEVVESLRGLLPNLRYVRQRQPLMAYAVHAACCALASGDYIFAIADDDFTQEAGLLRAMEIMDQQPNVAAVYGRWFRHHGIGTLEETIAAGKSGMAGRDRLEGVFGREDALKIFHEAHTMEMPVFRRSVFLNSHLPLPHLLPFDFHGMGQFMKHGSIAIIPDCVVVMSVHDQQNSRQIYADEIINSYLADFETFGAGVPEEMRRRAVVEVDVRTINKYLLSMELAREQGRFLLARQYLMRALGHGRLKDIRQRVRDFEQVYMTEMIAEALSQFYRVTRPTDTIVCEDTPECFAVAELFFKRHPETTIEVMDAEEILARAHSDLDLYFVGDPTLPDRRRQCVGLANGKIRTYYNLRSACRILD
ncbi:MAG: glycosyltransferase family 2 protein [Alphaproteobacteria bacterium]